MEGGHLFLAKRNHILNNEQHLAEIISIVGPPPPEFLRRSKRCFQFWDEKGMMLISYDWVILTFCICIAGNWKGSIPILEQSIKMRELQFAGEDRRLFFNLLRRVFCWLPEERPTAKELTYDGFLMQAVLEAGLSAMDMEMNRANTFNGKARHMGLKLNSLSGLYPAPKGIRK